MSFGDAWSRISETVREREKELRSGGFEEKSPVRPGIQQVHVKITGEAVAMTTTTTTSTTGTGTTSSTTTTTTTTTTTGTGTTSTTATPGMAVCYPGVVIVRDLRYLPNTQTWFETSINVWVQEQNDQPLTVGRRYVGDIVQSYNGRGLVIVNLASGAGGASCPLPVSAEDLDPDGIYGVILSGPQCCFDNIEIRCNGETPSGFEWRRVKVYIGVDPDTGRIVFKVAYGEWEPNFPPSDWAPCAPPPTDDFSQPNNSSYLVIV